MKQHITREQLGELTVKGKESLTKWAVDHKYTSPEIRTFSWYENNLLLSIGQMIEFLEKHTSNADLNIRIHSAGSGWKKPGQRLVDIYGLPVSEIEDEDNLCDALWEAVTSILSK